MIAGKTYYEILNLPKVAFNAVIEERYKELAKEYYNIKGPKTEVKISFMYMTKAYSVLGHKDKRREYDEHLHELQMNSTSSLPSPTSSNSSSEFSRKYCNCSMHDLAMMHILGNDAA